MLCPTQSIQLGVGILQIRFEILHHVRPSGTTTQRAFQRLFSISSGMERDRNRTVSPLETTIHVGSKLIQASGKPVSRDQEMAVPGTTLPGLFDARIG